MDEVAWDEQSNIGAAQSTHHHSFQLALWEWASWWMLVVEEQCAPREQSSLSLWIGEQRKSCCSCGEQPSHSINTNTNWLLARFRRNQWFCLLMGWNGIDEIDGFVFFSLCGLWAAASRQCSAKKEENEDKKPINESMKWKQQSKISEINQFNLNQLVNGIWFDQMEWNNWWIELDWLNGAPSCSAAR